MSFYLKTDLLTFEAKSNPAFCFLTVGLFARKVKKSKNPKSIEKLLFDFLSCFFEKLLFDFLREKSLFDFLSFFFEKVTF